MIGEESPSDVRSRLVTSPPFRLGGAGLRRVSRVEVSTDTLPDSGNDDDVTCVEERGGSGRGWEVDPWVGLLGEGCTCRDGDPPVSPFVGLDTVFLVVKYNRRGHLSLSFTEQENLVGRLECTTTVPSVTQIRYVRNGTTGRTDRLVSLCLVELVCLLIHFYYGFVTKKILVHSLCNWP